MLKKSPLINTLIIFILSISLAGCATVYNPATGREEIILIDTRSEIAIGASSVTQLGNKYKLSESKQDLERLNRIGQKIALASDRQDLKYSFYLIEDKSLNAFTVPGGHVYIFRGLYELLDDDELACVLAHEIGHASARHPAKRLEAALGYQILSTIALAACQKKGEGQKKQTAYIAYAASTAFNLAMLGYSREDEFQADELAVKYSHKAGFNPRGMIGVFKKLGEKQEKGFPVPYILRSHPYLKERAVRTEEKIAELSS